MIKAIFFDVDGTLVDMGTHRIPPSTLEALNRLREQGIRLFLSTGRHMCMLNSVRAAFDFDGYVTVSGQLCTCGGRVVHRNPIPRPAVEQLLAAAREEGFSCIFLEEEECYLNRKDELALQFLEEFDLRWLDVQAPERALEGNLYQVIVMLDKEQEGKLLDRAPGVTTTRWHPIFLDVLPQGGGKDMGIAAVLAHLGLTADQAMAFGDGENDISMLRCVGLGVAMGNASDEVKGQADYVTAPVGEDGVVRALRHFGLL